MDANAIKSESGVPESVSKLVERFAAQGVSYVDSHYKEAEVRREFIEPLFEANEEAALRGGFFALDSREKNSWFGAARHVRTLPPAG